VTQEIMVSPWRELSRSEQLAATEAARREGQRAARWYLVAPEGEDAAGSNLRRSRWAQEHGSLDRIDDALLRRYAIAQSVTCEYHYVEHVIERYHPEHAATWWDKEREARMQDPRVWCFCEGYEHERCRILGMAGPPTPIPDLEICLRLMQEEEERAEQEVAAAEGLGDNDSAASERFLLEWDHQGAMLQTDLAAMLLWAAIYRRERRRAGDVA
jgi:hypothetical protein